MLITPHDQPLITLDFNTGNFFLNEDLTVKVIADGDHMYFSFAELVSRFGKSFYRDKRVFSKQFEAHCASLLMEGLN